MSQQVKPEELGFEDGVYLVKLARLSVEHYIERGEKPSIPGDVSEKLRRPGAAFVTIETYYTPEKRELRGCIGYIMPIKPLVETVIDVALEAAFNDPRFEPLKREELNSVTFEVTVLGPIEPLPRDPKLRPRAFRVGIHGLFIRKGFFQGILLPQVPIEYMWDEETFLAETCVKAGLPPHCWLDEETEFYKYTARIWREREPKGNIEERDLVKELEDRRFG